MRCVAFVLFLRALGFYLWLPCVQALALDLQAMKKNYAALEDRLVVVEAAQNSKHYSAPLPTGVLVTSPGQGLSSAPAPVSSVLGPQLSSAGAPVSSVLGSHLSAAAAPERETQDAASAVKAVYNYFGLKVDPHNPVKKSKLQAARRLLIVRFFRRNGYDADGMAISKWYLQSTGGYTPECVTNAATLLESEATKSDPLYVDVDQIVRDQRKQECAAVDLYVENDDLSLPLQNPGGEYSQAALENCLLFKELVRCYREGFDCSTAVSRACIAHGFVRFEEFKVMVAVSPEKRCLTRVTV